MALYQDSNLRQVVSDDNYDPDTSWADHLARGSAGGVDHNAPFGTPLYANCAGTVHLIGLADGGSGGRTLNINLGDTGWYDQFMHMSAFNVKEGQSVRQGQLVGYSGASGFGKEMYYQPHFHLHRYDKAGTRLNAWHYFGGDGVTDSRDLKPGRIVATLDSGEPNDTFWRRMQWWGRLKGGFKYPSNGFMTIPAWKSIQTAVKAYGYTGVVDGVPGKLTYTALQRVAVANGAKSDLDGALDTQDFIGLSKFLNTL